MFLIALIPGGLDYFLPPSSPLPGEFVWCWSLLVWIVPGVHDNQTRSQIVRRRQWNSHRVFRVKTRNYLNFVKLLGVNLSEYLQILLEACLVRTAFEAVELDSGILPGDQSGAAGIDSALFAHLKRNWQSKNLPKEHRFAGVSAGKQRKNISRKEIVRIEVKAKPLRSVLHIQKRRSRIVKRVIQKRKSSKKTPKIVEDTYK